MHSILFQTVIFQMCSFIQELRKQLENKVLTIDTLQKENRATIECHENVCSASAPYLSQSPLVSYRIFFFSWMN